MQLQISDRSELKVTITTEDPTEQRICEAYWNWNHCFTEPIAQIARRFGLKTEQVNDIVQHGCRATRTDCKCLRCGEPTVWFKRRYEFEGVVGEIFSRPEQFDYCAECQPIVKREEQETQAQSKIEMMKWALDGLMHQSLEPVEFDFLVQLAGNSSIIKAVNEVNISRKYAVKLLTKLDAIHLIDWYKNSKLTWEDWEAPVKMLGELRNMLRNEKSRRRVKSIFSADSLELFRRLKSQYPFVFPELPLSTFIDKSDVEPLFEEDDLYLFMTCRVDFLICDRDGTPVSAIEHDRAHRGDSRLKEFRRKILAAVGLPVAQINNAQMKEGELP
jgi:hypothetical protein